MPRKSAFKCYFGCTPLKGTVHHFPPSEYPNLEKFNQWKSVLSELDKGKGDTYIYNNIRICDNHFEECYRTANGRLTKNAIPTLNIASTSKDLLSVEMSASSSSDRKQTSPVHQVSTSHKNLDLQAVEEPEPKLSEPQMISPKHARQVSTSHKNLDLQAVEEPEPKLSEPQKISPKHARQDYRPRCVSRIKHTKEYTQLKLKLLKLRGTCKDLKQKVRKAAKISQSKAFLKAVENLPEPAAVFVGMQLNKASTKPRGRRYTTEEKILSLTIYKQSQKAYNLMRRLFALPSKRSILKVLNSITLKPGVNRPIIENLKKTVKKLHDEKKICTLIFDEVSLSPGLFFNKTWDEIIGFEDFGGTKTQKIADHALVFMIKGLKGKYKQPICFTFCQSATKTTQLKNLIKTIIHEVHSTGLKVIATVCDQSSTNVSVINSLKNETKQKYLSEGKEYRSTGFEIDGEKIFPVFDPPHLLKGLRNNLLTKDLRFIQNGEVKLAKWDHLKMLFDADVGEDDIRLVNKLTECHVNKEKIPKMKVKHAAQVFSQRVSAAMRFLANHNILPKECLSTADLLLLVDKLFDSFNGHSYQASPKIYKCALRKSSPHFKLWNELVPILRSMRFKVEKIEKNGTTSTKFIQVPSLKHWIDNINVYKEMFTFINNNYNISSLLTRNINQDPIENFFCNIRSNGVRNTSPTCSQFIGAFKTLLVNNLTSPHSVGANCEQDDNKALTPLKNIFFQKVEAREQPTKVNIDYLIDCLNVQTSQNALNTISKEAKRYVAGYILKNTLKKICKSCHTCRMQLVSTTPPKNKDYILERDVTKKSLNYPSEALYAFLDEVCIIIQTVLNEEPQKSGIKETLSQMIKLYCNLSLFSCETHKEKVQNFVMNSIINIVLYSWCSNVNRLLKGKVTNCDSNKTKIQALNYFKTHRKISNK